MDKEELMKQEWILAWEHIKNSKTIYWGLFAILVIINGVAIKYVLATENLCDLTTELFFNIPVISVMLLFLLLINIFMTFTYQREHFAQKENYIQIKNIRKEILGEPENHKWNYYFQEKAVFKKGIGYGYFKIIKLIINLIPLVLYIVKGQFLTHFIFLFVIFVAALFKFRCNDKSFKSHKDKFKL